MTDLRPRTGDWSVKSGSCRRADVNNHRLENHPLGRFINKARPRSGVTFKPETLADLEVLPTSKDTRQTATTTTVTRAAIANFVSSFAYGNLPLAADRSESRRQQSPSGGSSRGVRDLYPAFRNATIDGASQSETEGRILGRE
jgi:hypothetical protein